MCHYNRSTQNIACCIFSCRALNNFCKLLVIIVIYNEKQITELTSNIISKRHSIFTENLTIFFSNAEKTRNVPESKFDIFQKIVFLRCYGCKIYTVRTSALDFKQLHIISKLYPIKRILSARIPYLALTLLMSYFKMKLQHGSSFKRVSLVKDIIYFKISHQCFKKEIKYLKPGAPTSYTQNSLVQTFANNILHSALDVILAFISCIFLPL